MDNGSYMDAGGSTVIDEGFMTESLMGWDASSPAMEPLGTGSSTASSTRRNGTSDRQSVLEGVQLSSRRPALPRPLPKADSRLTNSLKAIHSDPPLVYPALPPVMTVQEPQLSLSTLEMPLLETAPDVIIPATGTLFPAREYFTFAHCYVVVPFGRHSLLCFFKPFLMPFLLLAGFM